jgi:hypothetical protein
MYKVKYKYLSKQFLNNKQQKVARYFLVTIFILTKGARFGTGC